jgi:hypothetical protein
MAVTPRDLVEVGFADAVVDAADPDAVRRWVAAGLDGLRALPPQARLATRDARWSAPLPGSPRYAHGRSGHR